MSIIEFDRSLSWSLGASKTGESTKCPWVEAVGLKAPHQPYPQEFCTLFSFACIKRPRLWPVEHLQIKINVTVYSPSITGPHVVTGKQGHLRQSLFVLFTVIIINTPARKRIIKTDSKCTLPQSLFFRLLPCTV